MSRSTARCTLTGLALLGMLASSDHAWAQLLEEKPSRTRQLRSSGEDPVRPIKPKWLGAELRFSPYEPKLTSDPRGQASYDRYFGKSGLINGHPTLLTMELTWFPYDGWGLIGLSFQGGYWRAKGRSQLCGGGACDPDTVGTGENGNTKTSLTIFPVGAGVVYKMDLLNRFTKVPLIAYGKASIDYYFWWMRTGGSIARTDLNGDGSEDRARGGTLGYSLAVGLAVELNWLEPDVARSARATSGQASSQLFAEIRHIFGDQFGASQRLDMTDTLISMGFAVEFQ